jgi:hypothetical protein
VWAPAPRRRGKAAVVTTRGGRAYRAASWVLPRRSQPVAQSRARAAPAHPTPRARARALVAQSTSTSTWPRRPRAGTRRTSGAHVLRAGRLATPPSARFRRPCWRRRRRRQLSTRQLVLRDTHCGWARSGCRSVTVAPGRSRSRRVNARSATGRWTHLTVAAACLQLQLLRQRALVVVAVLLLLDARPLAPASPAADESRPHGCRGSQVPTVAGM